MRVGVHKSRGFARGSESAMFVCFFTFFVDENSVRFPRKPAETRGRERTEIVSEIQIRRARIVPRHEPQLLSLLVALKR